MGLFKILSRLISISASSVVILLALTLYEPFNLDLQDVKSYELKLPQRFDGVFQSNSKLDGASRLFEGQIKGPESISEWNGEYYTALFDGRVVKFSKDGKKLTTVAKGNGPKCVISEHSRSKECCAFIGTRVDSQGNLYLVDANHGVKRIRLNSTNHKIELIIPSDKKIGSSVSKFWDDILVDEGQGRNGGNVYYITDMSTRWGPADISYGFLEHDTTGRLIKYDEDDKKFTVVADKLNYPNGLSFTDKKDAILMTLCGEHEIVKVFIKGPQRGTVKTLLTDLPGELDNIKRSSRKDKETYWVAVFSPRTLENQHIFDRLSTKPLVRTLIGRLMYGTGQLLHKLNGLQDEYVKNPTIKEKLSQISQLLINGDLIFLATISPNGLVFEIDVNGNILRSLDSQKGLSLISEAHEFKENGKTVLYLGSFMNNYIGKLVLN